MTMNTIHAMVMIKANQFIAQITALIMATSSNALYAVSIGSMMTVLIGDDRNVRYLWIPGGRWRWSTLPRANLGILCTGRSPQTSGGRLDLRRSQVRNHCDSKLNSFEPTDQTESEKRNEHVQTNQAFEVGFFLLALLFTFH
jgi:hypothetical protein